MIYESGDTAHRERVRELSIESNTGNNHDAGKEICLYQ